MGALVPAILVGTAPAVWFGAGSVELHVFSAAGSSFAVWMALCLPGHPAWRAPLACVATMLTHTSTILMAPLLLFLVLIGERQRGVSQRSRIVWGGASATVCVVVLRLLVQRAPMGNSSSSEWGLRAMRSSAKALHSFQRFWTEVSGEMLEPYVLLAVAPLALLVMYRRGSGQRLLAPLVALAGLLGLWGGALQVILPPGQFILPTTPLLALSVALCLARIPMGSLRGPLLIALLGLHLAFAIPIRGAMARDPDRAWAEQTAQWVESPCLVVCGYYRHRRLQKRIGDSAVRYVRRTPARELLPILAGGRTVYIDGELIGTKGREQAAFTKDVLSLFELQRVTTVNLWRVVGALEYAE